MKLIIDIPEETYNEVCGRGLFLCPRDRDNLTQAIKNGIPLDDVKAKINQLPLVLLVGYDHIEKDSVLQVLDNIGRK